MDSKTIFRLILESDLTNEAKESMILKNLEKEQEIARLALENMEKEKDIEKKNLEMERERALVALSKMETVIIQIFKKLTQDTSGKLQVEG